MLFYSLFLTTFLFLLITLQKKFLILVDNPHHQKHKILDNKNIPLSGGMYLLLSILFSTSYAVADSTLLIISLIPFLILGIYSDIKTNFSPKLRFLFQLILILLMVIFLDIKISNTGVFFLDTFINHKGFNLAFTSFCIIILLNGSNFCDGINCNVIGYYLILTIGIYFSELIIPEIYSLEKIIFIFTIFYLFNLINKCFLGDNGVYILSIFMAVFIIKFININKDVSPLLALNLLWYPAFENLFTILRRIFKKQTIQDADRYHLHTLIYEKLNKRFKNYYSNSLAGIILNIYMLIFMILSIHYADNAKRLILILTINIIFYMYLYLKLSVKKSSSE
tara:strand:- start:273 stop:1283 length:1011 start_codon:yes stop_codon:yes gene_type:complete